MIQKRALVVTDSFGVLEVFGPYGAHSADLEVAKSDLEVWAVDCGDDSVEMHDLPMHDPELLAGWIADPAEFYEVGE